MMKQYKIEGGDSKRIIFEAKIISAKTERAAIRVFLTVTDIPIEYIDVEII